MVASGPRRPPRTVGFILERAGARVLSADDGAAAIALVAQHGPEIALVLLDLTMPGMNGAQTLEQLRRLAPEVPVILMSGYDEQDARGMCDPEQLAGFIQKPFDLDSLLATVRRALEVR